MTENTPDPSPATTPDPEAAPRARRSRRPILIGVLAGVLAAGLTAGAIALAVGLDDDDEIVVTSTSTTVPMDGSTAVPTPNATMDDDLVPGDPEYASVIAAALDAVGGGTVTEVDRGDDPGEEAWKVEIRLDNGDEAEVRLAADLSVIRVEIDND